MSQSFGNISHIHCFRVHILVCIHQADFNNVGEGARQVSCSKNSKLGGGGGGGIAVSSSEFILKCSHLSLKVGVGIYMY